MQLKNDAKLKCDFSHAYNGITLNAASNEPITSIMDGH